MPALSRPKDGVLSHAYVAGIHVLKHGKYKDVDPAGTSPATTKKHFNVNPIPP